MNGVLYTLQLEPITVVDLPMSAWDRLSRGEVIRLQVEEPNGYLPSFVHPGPDETVFHIVEVFGEPLRRKGFETLMLFTKDETQALRLRAGFLPGQQSDLRRRRDQAFAEGFAKALSLLP